jgi:hypothetical protein
MTTARVVRLVAAVGMAVIGVLWAWSPDTKWPGVGLVVVAIGIVATEVGRIRREARLHDPVARDGETEPASRHQS